MANLRAKVGLNINKINLNSLASDRSYLYDNVYEKFNGITYQDVIVAGAGTAYFGGTGFKVSSSGAVKAGTVTGFLAEISSKYSGLNPGWWVEKFKIDAKKVYSAVLSPSVKDDLAIVQRILSGNDTIKLSNFADNMKGFDGNDRIWGNGGNDKLDGGKGNDTLYGGLGKDTLTGGKGKDTFVFDSKLGSGNVDTIKDFSVKDDTIHLENRIFTKLAKSGTLSKSNFVANATGKAMDKDDYIVYNTKTGKLYYDADGSGSKAAVEFAVVGTKLKLTAADFVVI